MKSIKTLLFAGATLAFSTAAQAEQPQMTAEQQAEMQKKIQALIAAQQQKPKVPDMPLAEAIELFSKGAAVSTAEQLTKDDYINKDLFLKSFNEALEGKIKMTDLDEKKMRDAQLVIQNDFQKKQQAEMDKKVSANRAAGEKFLEENKKKEGVKITASGLQYKVIKEGKGESPKAEDEVTVNYTGKLTDGTVFDASAKHGGPATFPLNGVIPGWTEGVALMKPGAKYEFVIPSNLAYGKRGGGRMILPDSVLCFEIELIKVIKKEAPKAEDTAKSAKDAVKK